MVDRQQILEIVVAVTAVLLMLGAMIGIGTMYGEDGGTLSSDGGELLIGAIIGFILLLTAAGISLAYVLNHPDEGVETDDDADARNAA